ncbi:uncharacterized protein PFL1_02825 [Pseudozyma flocculosa PF-1]|uniref:Uncharacterized protein n=2 Tax=Pseudozyma flocculosa TaxID=84751 RepID=A0A5C3F0X6_9BASI|nr:uncharacterized protein PFL1_02825 [Pseudozyma flocculosa PF-1]EPQ29606.1 hypothetical protein PFL1_02825 [Pseudozyma flocculosa PF-1]SPO38163.1 uncharacterized protein PSFLO_03640 [Pseudozyma flocculosa]
MASQKSTSGGFEPSSTAGPTQRFVRSVADVGKPSPLRWLRAPAHLGDRTYVRRMGLVESFFSTMSSLHHGRTDIFHRIPLRFPAEAKDKLLARLPLAYAVLCRRHPLLSSHVVELTPDLERFDEERAKSLRHSGSGDGSASALSEPHFVYQVPSSAGELLDRARERVLFLSPDWSETIAQPAAKKAPAEQTLDGDRTKRWLKQYVWNGPRRFLSQKHPYGLGRVLVLPTPQSATGGSLASIDLVLCVAHCVGDGLSVSSLAAELLGLLTSDDLPHSLGNVRDVPSEATFPGATHKEFGSVSDEIAAALETGLLRDHRRADGGAGAMSPDFIEPLLPPPIEAAYPPFLDPSATGSASLARTRWFWALRRVRAQVRSARSLNDRLTDFAARISDADALSPSEERDWGAHTNWSAERLDARETGLIVAVAKRKGVRIGALLYAVSACALNQLAIEDDREAVNGGAQHADVTKSTVMGFPFSIRQYLRPESTVFEGRADAALDEPARPSTLSVQLGFGGISFPAPDVFSLSTDPSAVQDGSLNRRDQVQLWQMARHAQKRLDAMFRHPPMMMADGFVTALDRENRFRVQGVRDVFAAAPQKDDEAEANDDDDDDDDDDNDEHRPGHLKKNMQGPGSSLNYSMLGSLDGIFSGVNLTLPSSWGSGATGARLEVGTNMLIGVRCREGEAFGTAFTIGGCLTLELGHDLNTWSTEKVEKYLWLMRRILIGLAEAPA